MAFDSNTSTYFPSYTSNGTIDPGGGNPLIVTGIAIGDPSTDLSLISFRHDCDDVRVLLYGILDKFVSQYNELLTADKATQMSVRSSTSLVSNTILKKTYTLSFNVNISENTVTPE
jgi:hypothetical protein